MNPRIAFIAAPLLTMAYGVIRLIDGLDGAKGPGLAWTAGHLAFIGALVMFVVTFWEMRRLAGRGLLATTSAVLGTVGVAALIAQFGIDIVVGFLAVDHDAMGPLFDQVQSVPLVSPIVYQAVPFLFYIGQLAIVIQLAATRKVKVWTPVLVLVDLMLPMVDKNFIPLGALFLLISFLPLARLSAVAAPRTPAHAHV
ncbi:hypothetical protein ACIBG8_49490 [Nonomuraea sp. NPDC050556]|uniref:hypothetical protein n=1 Tax=Nonomuraea sp. NPDC050556 TaxID=3364369 RepID=UPI0037B50BCA